MNLNFIKYNIAVEEETTEVGLMLIFYLTLVH